MLKQISKFFVKYFLQGLLYTAPISFTLLIFWWVFTFFNELLPTTIPGLGIIIIIIFITIMGFIGSSLIAGPIFSYFDSLFEEVPLIKVIYSSVKDLLSAFVGQKKKFTEPVLVKMTNDTCLEKIGFVTTRDLSTIGISKGKIAVFLPHSYNISGNLYIVPAENVTPIDATPAEVMRFVVSGGIIDVKE